MGPEPNQKEIAISIASVNIEGIKSNSLMLKKLHKNFDVVCVQEHWLNSYEVETFKNNFKPQHSSFKCRQDDFDFSHHKRGNGGVAIFWKRRLDPFISELNCGNERIQAIVINSDPKICLINVYMPVNKNNKSAEEYLENLCLIEVIIDTTEDCKHIIIGDFNASLKRDNAQDRLLQKFLKDRSLLTEDTDQMTYFGHNGTTSQIDYVISDNSNLLKNYRIGDPSGTNTSSHCEVSVKFQVCLPNKICQENNNKSNEDTIPKFQWSKANYKAIEVDFMKKLPKNILQDDYNNVDSASKSINNILSQAIINHVPQKSYKQRRTRLYPEYIKNIIQEGKFAHFQWKENGRPLNGPLWDAKQEAKKSTRRVIKNAASFSKQTFFEDILKNVNNRNFHRLVKFTRSSVYQSKLGPLLIDGQLVFDTEGQLQATTQHYQKLCTPIDLPNFDDVYHEQVNTDVHYIEDNIGKCDGNPITVEEVQEAIKKLNTGKAADAHSIKAEVLQNISYSISPILAILFEKCRQKQLVPNEFKKGILTSIPKKGKSPMILDNHRGITVISTIGKVFEHIILKRYKPTQKLKQSELQFGFTESHSPSMASLIINEAIIEAKETKVPLFTCTLDARKAFDTVCHSSLIRKVYLQNTEEELVGIINAIYKDMTTQVKLDGKLGEEFKVLQGTRQGSVLSPALYKTYINDLLKFLEENGIGAHIGDLYIATPSVADDVSLLSNNTDELQTMLDVTGNYANMERYTFNASKSEIANLGSKAEDKEVCYINNDPIFHGDSILHLGICHSNSGSTSFVTSKISLLFKTTYSLMGSGLHGYNGLGPITALRIYQCYVLPRFLYGMASANLNKQQIQKLESAHRKILRQIQCLPERTASAAVYLLPGQLPFEGHLDLSRLSLLNSILHSNNSVLLDIMMRQVAVKTQSSKSWFVNIVSLLQKYNLPLLSTLLDCSLSKNQMKSLFKRAVNNWWTDALKQECTTKSTLVFLNIEDLSTEDYHPVWKTVKPNLFDIQRAHIKARLLTDTYILQHHIAKFKKEDSDTCKLCILDTEDRSHFLTSCAALFEVRDIWIPKIKDIIIKKAGSLAWLTLTKDRNLLMKLILDSASLKKGILKKFTKEDLEELETLTRIYCFKLHFRRCQLLQKLN